MRTSEDNSDKSVMFVIMGKKVRLGVETVLELIKGLVSTGAVASIVGNNSMLLLLLFVRGNNSVESTRRCLSIGICSTEV